MKKYKASKKINADKIIRILQKRYKVRHWRARPFRVLIGCILSQRTKDEVGIPASERLFRVAHTPEKMLKLSVRQIAKLIYPVGFYNQKAKRIKQACRVLLKKYNGRVPKTREELMSLPGIGGKCADIVLLFSYGHAVIPVDTHVTKIAHRLGWTTHKQPENIREDLHKLFPPKKRVTINNLLVEFGKEICKAPRPKCYVCPIEKLCPYHNKNYKIPKNLKKV